MVLVEFIERVFVAFRNVLFSWVDSVNADEAIVLTVLAVVFIGVIFGCFSHCMRN